MKKIVVDKENSNQRLDKFLFKFLNGAPKSFICKMIRKKNIKLNDKRAMGSEILNAGDQIFLYLADETVDKFRKCQPKQKSSAPLKILHEDKNFLFCEKPAGILSQPSTKFDTDTVLNRLYGACGDSAAICNRLDRNTSGIIICAKNFLAAQEMNKIIAAHFVDKYYLTIVKGRLDKPGRLENYVSKDDSANVVEINSSGAGKKIITEYTPLKFTNDFTLLEVKIITGKSHQIRVHLQNIGHPIIGDTKYGDANTNLFFRQKFGLHHQLLHAYKIKFHSGELAGKKIKSPLPKIFSDVEQSAFFPFVYAIKFTEREGFEPSVH